MSEFKKFETPKEVNEWVEKYYSEDDKRMLSANTDMDSPLSKYKYDEYIKMNLIVRKGVEEHHPYVLKLQETLNGFRIPDDIEVTRFVSCKELFSLWKNTICRRSYVYPQFLSTTMLKEHYSMDDIKNKRIPIKIYIPKGTRGVFLTEVNPKRPEFEILLPYHLSIKRVSLFVYKIELSK